MSTRPRADRPGALLFAAFLAAGCAAVSPAPRPWQVTETRAPLNPYGAWANVSLRRGRVIAGELLAVQEGNLFVGSAEGLRRVPIECIGTLRLAVFEADFGLPGAVSILGLLSSLSHGYLLVLSAPVWLITAGVATHSASSRGYETFGGARKIEEARTFARFPASLPPGYLERAPIREAFDGRCESQVPPSAPAAPPTPPPRATPTSAPPPPDPAIAALRVPLPAPTMTDAGAPDAAHD
jgi:hypothetical protein